MKIAIITVAGISSRFNIDCTDEQKVLKAIYYTEKWNNTLLYHMLRKCSFADNIIIVGGYEYESLCAYCDGLDLGLREKLILVYNEHYHDYGSGYSLYLGLKEAFKYNADEILFVEGDLDVDDDSFYRVINTKGNVLTYNYEPIYADKAVVLYADGNNSFHYAFNSDHGLLSIKDSFSCILNSGQIWKFHDLDALRESANEFYAREKTGTNLYIIQCFLNRNSEVSIVGLDEWTNCNTKEDYNIILARWEEKL